MASDCASFLPSGSVFPRRPRNRPGLERVSYRIATWPEFRDAMLQRVDAAAELRAWTHRTPDDPAVALLEGTAILGDILTFYQEHYANEAWLRTADWRASVDRLVRLTGYRLGPGAAGDGVFAFEVRGDGPVIIPADYPLKAELEGGDPPAEFQTDAELVAHPHLSAFHLYRQRTYAGYIAAGAMQVEIADVGGTTGDAAIESLELGPGDRVMLVPDEPNWTPAGSSFSAVQQAPQILTVADVETIVGRTIVTFDTAVAATWSGAVHAYRLDRSFRHFGQAAPPTSVQNITDGSGTITGSRERTSSYERHVDRSHGCTLSSVSVELPGELIALDAQVQGLRTGAPVIVTTIVRDGEGGPEKRLAVVRHITALQLATLTFGQQTSPCTLMTLNAALVAHTELGALRSDVRDYEIHETSSPRIALRPKATHPDGAFASGVSALSFHGTAEAGALLAGRRLALTAEDGRFAQLVMVTEADAFVPVSGGGKGFFPLSFDQPPVPFQHADFDEHAPTVTVHGNLIDAHQGKDEGEKVLGNGDARQTFQTFRLPKAPLTYRLSPGATPPQRPDLAVRVGGRLWLTVPSLFGQAAAAEVYITREDETGDSYIQFGDGVTGARLPSGVGNVTARFRTGIGANGPIAAGKTPALGSSIDRLEKAHLPGVVSGGGAPEETETAREAAPARLQSLGRMVSLRDYETELLTIPGVVRATAGWTRVDGTPALALRVLLEAGREAEFGAVKETVAAYQRCRGSDRHPLVVEQAFLRYTWATIDYAHDPVLTREDIEARIHAALGVAGQSGTARSGLLGLRSRALGQREYRTRIEGVVQQVAGVVWCQATGLGLFASGEDEPASLTPPPAPQPRTEVLSPLAGELLQLAPAHLSLHSQPAAVTEDCE